MANIIVENLAKHSIIGADLFNDTESFMLDLSDRQLDIQGGCGGNNPVKLRPNTLPIIVIYSCAPARPQA
ncbi:hypothetical protein [Chamaesiphon sp. OTE_75_metabat_556]|uniref:hypothetical protein n=1 Tax=Chamaesiphon sp. OTE_75_metabat_556 TaxID=2964692 RepID=UPI00286CF1A5|nr:hypothetical protein [Chamaesiphon sp. OTE_75_metabat_556]